MYCIRAQLENDYLLVSDLIKLIGISRAGAETMIKECEEAHWIKINAATEISAKYKMLILMLKLMLIVVIGCGELSMSLTFVAFQPQ